MPKQKFRADARPMPSSSKSADAGKSESLAVNFDVSNEDWLSVLTWVRLAAWLSLQASQAAEESMRNMLADDNPDLVDDLFDSLLFTRQLLEEIVGFIRTAESNAHSSLERVDPVRAARRAGAKSA